MQISSIATILTPIFSGFIIQEFSYYVLFVILIIEALIIIAISFKIKDFTVSDKKLELNIFFKKVKDTKHLQDIYKCMFYRRISSQGAITELLPIILFLRLGTEMHLGTYNSLFAIISILSLQILKVINNKNIRKGFYPYLAIIIFISSLLVIYNASFITLLIYYILMNSFGTVIESESCSIVYAAIKTDDLAKYKREHILTYNIYMTIGQIISYSLVYVLYNYFYDVNILSVSVSILMFFLIISTIYLRRTEKYLQNDIEILIREENLGDLVQSITKVTGGLSHRMYKVVTDKGIYAIKELNSGIMKRKEAYSNFVFSEKVTDIAKENGISAIGARRFKNNEIIKKINDKYFMVFDWLEGKTLKAEEITDKHCEIIGETLAKIHNIDFSKIEDNERKSINVEQFNWNKYLELSQKEDKNYIEILKQNIDLLYELNEKSNEAITYASNNLIISHTDFDRKNILWQEYKPFIIDWEASGYINPTIELIQVAWYWSGGDIENLDYKKFEIVVNSYKKYAKKEINANIDKLIYADIYSGLCWLNYNFKRSLCIENEYEQDEIKLAESEIIQSIREIKYNVSQMDNMIEILKRN